jgi:hypothetical protein
MNAVKISMSISEIRSHAYMGHIVKDKKGNKITYQSLNKMKDKDVSVEISNLTAVSKVITILD